MQGVIYAGKGYPLIVCDLDEGLFCVHLDAKAGLRFTCNDYFSGAPKTVMDRSVGR